MYLNTVISIGVITQRLELLVDDSDTRLVGTIDNVTYVLGCLSQGYKLAPNDASRLDRGLSMKPGCGSATHVGKNKDIPGKDTLNRIFSMT